MQNYLVQIPSSSSNYVETNATSTNRSQAKPVSTPKKETRSKVPVSSIKPTLNIAKTRRQAVNAANPVVV